MTTPRYSQRPEEVSAGRSFLVGVAIDLAAPLPTYATFAESYGGVPRAAAPVLNSLAAQCAEAAEPDLTVLVVQGETGRPGAIDDHPFVVGDPADERRWAELLAQVRSYAWPEADRLPAEPRIGQSFRNRTAIAGVWGGDYQGGMATFPRERDRVVNIFSDDDGPYPDREVPGTDRIDYIGQGRGKHQELSARGNRLMDEARVAGAAARYWHKPSGAPFRFEHWVVVVARRREWNLDGEWRLAYVYTLAPVGGPDRSTWPADVLAEVALRSVDDEAPASPPEVRAASGKTAEQLYQELVDRAATRAGQPAGVRTAKEYARSAAARQAVLLRADNACENSACTGMPGDRRPDGTAILDVDHVKDLAKGGPDEPSNMVALCPNCHAAKTRGANRTALARTLAGVARARHSAWNPRVTPELTQTTSVSLDDVEA